MRFSESFLRQLKERASIADYAGKLVSWDRRKSQPAKGDYWAPCPFHSEKTASFHVRDPQGSYKCFGCGEAGGVIDLAMKLEGLSFPEAVERLANFAGLALPEDDNPRDEAEEKKRKRLFGAVMRAQDLFIEALASPAARHARDYLDRRGLPQDVRVQFGIGYAPGGWTATMDKLKNAGFTEEELIEAGLASRGDDNRRAIDVFRDRIMFPIADAQGRLIAFGGRALDPEAKAKYINSPETPLYHKGRTLYRLKEARTLSAKSKARGLVVAEGYLDVVAFERAGIGAVAPCGTAVTEDQLALIWRSGGEPVFCFDGDVAGKRAADRALDLALPQMAPGHTLSIALLPEGQDPDDVFQKSGPEALGAIIAAATPAVAALFARERDREALDTPERKSGFKKRLREAASRIADEDTKKLYLSDLLRRADEVLRPAQAANQPYGQPYQGGGQRQPGQQRRYQKGQRWEPPPAPATAELKSRQAGSPRHLAVEDLLREAVDRPAFLDKFADWVARLPLPDPDLDAIREAMLDLLDNGTAQPVDREALSRHLVTLGEERAAARVGAWPQAGPRSAGGAGGGKPKVEDETSIEAEWLTLVTLDVVLPAIKEEMAALAAAADQGDAAAFERFLLLDKDARKIEDEFRSRQAGEPGPGETGERAA
jgi:DNA primase